MRAAGRTETCDLVTSSLQVSLSQEYIILWQVSSLLFDVRRKITALIELHHDEECLEKF